LRPLEEYHPTPDEEREAEIWYCALEHVQRLGRQFALTRAGGHGDIEEIERAAREFIEVFASEYGQLGRLAIASAYRMAKMETPRLPIWLEVDRWRRNADPQPGDAAARPA
jgi:hypothetical protein